MQYIMGAKPSSSCPPSLLLKRDFQPWVHSLVKQTNALRFSLPSNAKEHCGWIRVSLPSTWRPSKRQREGWSSPFFPRKRDWSSRVESFVLSVHVRVCVLNGYDPRAQGMLLREVHQEALALQRQHTSSVGSSISSRHGQQARPQAASLMDSVPPLNERFQPSPIPSHTTDSGFSAHHGKGSTGGVLPHPTTDNESTRKM